jgi:hypothetical protein
MKRSNNPADDADGRQTLLDALHAIVDPSDKGVWMEVYRDAGGGYEGLQAIAHTALVSVDDDY